MTDPLYDEPTYLTELPEDLKLKRAAAARRRRWRRRLTLGAAVGVIGAVAALLATSLGGEEGSPSATSGAQLQQAETQGGSPETTAAGPRADWKPHPGPVPVLLYHAIETPTTAEPYPELFVEPRDFESQMQWLEDHGFEAVTLHQVEQAWYEGGTLPPKPVVISFDDGYPSQYSSGFTALEKRGWPGVLNLPAGGSELPDADVREIVDAGWELASKSTSNLDLTFLDPTTLEHEVAGSRRILGRRFGVPVRNFCYPLGRYSTTVISAVHRAGYVGAQTEIAGVADAAHPYIIDRIEILLSDGLDGFVAKLQSTGAA